MTGETMKWMTWLWTRLANERGEVAVGGPATLPPEVQEKLAKLDKLEKDHATLGYRLRAHEKVMKEFGDAVEYDGYNNPVRRVEVAPAPSYAAPGSHPLAGIVDNPQSVDAHYQSLYAQHLNKAGYVTMAQAQALANQAYELAHGNARVWRTYDKVTSQEKYKDLANAESDLYKRTVRLGQERQLLRPMDPAQKNLDTWWWANLEALQMAADLARLEAHEAAQQAAASTATGQAAQEKAGLSVGTTTVTALGSAEGAPPVSADGRVDWGKVGTDTAARGAQLPREAIPF